MHLPRKIEISGYTLWIQYKKKIVVNGVECFGVYDPNKKTITLLTGMVPARKKEIFLHEFLHFLEDIYRISIKHEDIASMSLGLLQLLNNTKINLQGGI